MENSRADTSHQSYRFETDAQDQSESRVMLMTTIGSALYRVGTGFLLLFTVLLVLPISYFGFSPIGGIMPAIIVSVTGILLLGIGKLIIYQFE